ncbi:DUF2393 family protein [Hydrogenimonas thermophila]|uniref:DUF2393 family protein n=1 Tax=Hydrogenimonas thermophila TaxID=223786 RepID=UPI002936FE36|nr:DUF2393 family protein [Hydrogenimonas thermophila]WOE69689.1 DUF2393 family protein [Hydrogenimonas thermophila]WOE72203.1 DUF2393 family protein [Hydrogenimonas thermophila]
MAEFIRSYLFYVFHSLTKYDIVAIGWVIFLAILLLVLAAFIKRHSLQYFILFLSILLLFFGPVGTKLVLDNYLRKADITINKVKALKYSNSVIVTGTITNSSRLPFKKCDIALLFTKPSNNNIMKKVTNTLKPLHTFVWDMNTTLEKKETKQFKIIVDSFKIKDFNLTVQPRCYP